MKARVIVPVAAIAICLMAVAVRHDNQRATILPVSSPIYTLPSSMPIDQMQCLINGGNYYLRSEPVCEIVHT